MESDNTMVHLLAYWEQTFYLELLLFVALSVAFVCSLRKRPAEEMKFFRYYLLAFILLLSFTYIYHYSFYPANYRSFYLPLVRSTTILVTMIELFAFSYFFYCILRTQTFRRIVLFMSIGANLLFGGTIAISLISTGRVPPQAIHLSNFIELLVLLLYVSVYFLEFYRSRPRDKPPDPRHFHINASLLIYLIGTLPTTLTSDFLYNHAYSLYATFYALTYLLYIILFLTIAKTFISPGKILAT